MGQSSATKAYNRQMADNASQELALQRQAFNAEQAGTQEQQHYRQGQADWTSFIKGKNYGAPPPGEFLNFNLQTPAMIAKQQERLRNVTGIGAAALGGTGDQSLGLQLSREHAAEEAGQNAGAAYENAVNATDQYYKGNNLAYASLGLQQQGDLLHNATNSAQFFFDQQRQTLPPSFFQTISPLLGGAISAGGALLGNPSLFHHA